MICELVIMHIFTILLCFLLSYSSLLQFEAVFTTSSSTEQHSCNSHDSISLLQFKNSMHDLNSSSSSFLCNDNNSAYPKMKSWNKTSNPDCCTWDGVTCHNITGHVIGLDLSCSRLRGFISQNSSLFHLSHLEKLNLAHNEFSFSKVSPNIGKLSSLTNLNLSYSDFEGKVPFELSNLSKLVSLDLSGNENLHYLFLNLSRISVLCLNGVNIGSNLPTNWSFSSSLTYLDLRYTGLHGTLPNSIFHFPRLETLLLNGNENLTVSLPKRNPSTTTTSSLQVLDLSGTNFDGHRFADDSLHFFPKLKSLSLVDCKINGSFPKSIANLTQIVQLDLSLNQLSEDFSSVISNLPEKLENLNLDWNSFTGNFPSDIGNLSQLSLKQNFLNGTLPLTITASPKLTSLDLSGNEFGGQIPFWVFSSPSITLLDLSRNCLSGQVIEFTAKSLVQIDLSSNNLEGSIDFTMFKNLNKLEFLKLSHNKLSVKFEDKSNVSFPYLLYLGLSSCEITQPPSFLINSKNLVFLDLSNNNLVGRIPHMIFGYPLKYLNLSHNSLSGLVSLKTLPLIENLELLDLSSNKFDDPLPLSICSLKSLYILDLSNNNFTGSIPECYGSLSSVLAVLNLERNNLDGIISMKFHKDNKLMSLNLNGNSLQGTLPESLVNCKNLRVLDVGNNKIKDEFPNLLKNLTNLQVLILKSNRFFGSLSNDKNEFFFPKLQVFDLSCNDFNGSLPVELLKSFKAMTNSDRIVTKGSHDLSLYNRDEKSDKLYRFPIIIFAMKGGIFQFNRILNTLVAIDLSSNHFVGEIPEIIGNLDSLRVLNLSHNNFSGPIPLSIGKLRCLESLDLSFNQFGGMIPWQLANVKCLEVLNLSQNHLEGRIPQGKKFHTFFNESYAGNLGLCGFPLKIDCAESNLSLHPSQAPSYHKDKDCCFWCEFTWKTLLIAYIFVILF